MIITDATSTFSLKALACNDSCSNVTVKHYNNNPTVSQWSLFTTWVSDCCIMPNEKILHLLSCYLWREQVTFDDMMSVLFHTSHA